VHPLACRIPDVVALVMSDLRDTRDRKIRAGFEIVETASLFVVTGTGMVIADP
jgi:hypothetical protein